MSLGSGKSTDNQGTARKKIGFLQIKYEQRSESLCYPLANIKFAIENGHLVR
jgi:hypothetical protein